MLNVLKNLENVLVQVFDKVMAKRQFSSHWVSYHLQLTSFDDFLLFQKEHLKNAS